jgi:hypothetical protein
VFKNGGIIFQVSWKMILSFGRAESQQQARDVQMDQLNSALKALQDALKKDEVYFGFYCGGRRGVVEGVGRTLLGVAAGRAAVVPGAFAVRPERVSAMRLSPLAGWFTTTLIVR